MRAIDYQSAEAWYQALGPDQKWAADNATCTLDELWRQIRALEPDWAKLERQRHEYLATSSGYLEGKPCNQDVARHIEQPSEVLFWGKKHAITPVAAPQQYGDGGALVGIAPISHRPQHFVVAVDSRWLLANLNDDAWRDHCDEIEDDIIDVWMAHTDDCEPECDCEFPRASWGDGKAWWLIGATPIMEDAR